MIAADVQVGQPTADPAATTGSTKPTDAQLAASWPATEASWSVVVNRVLSAPFALDNPNSQRNRRLGVLALLGWLREQPGDNWQQRWRVSGAEYQPDWRVLIGTDQANPLPHLSPGLLVLICADVIRPSLDWLLRFAPARHNLAAEMARTRDRAAFAELAALCQGRVRLQSQQQALTNVAIVMAVKGGNVAAVRVGDCLELLATPRAHVPPTTATPAAHCSINCCARTATSDRFQPQGLRVAGRQRHVLAELKDWDLPAESPLHRRPARSSFCPRS